MSLWRLGFTAQMPSASISILGRVSAESAAQRLKPWECLDRRDDLLPERLHPDVARDSRDVDFD
jgi:hypothetical protein